MMEVVAYYNRVYLPTQPVTVTLMSIPITQICTSSNFTPIKKIAYILRTMNAISMYVHFL